MLSKSLPGIMFFIAKSLFIVKYSNIATSNLFVSRQVHKNYRHKFCNAITIGRAEEQNLTKYNLTHIFFYV